LGSRSAARRCARILDPRKIACPTPFLADAIGSQLPITVVRNGALVDLIATPVELAG
jgi:hypothetical protein